ncbi:MAG: DnaD domain protein [Clostridia bacterium]|nr:DnaD domain protein [Clostridia bacterium]
MMMKLNFGQEVLVLPASVLSHVDEATPEQLCVLMWLASDLSLASKHKQLAKLAGCDTKSLKEAIRFWCKCGLILQEGEEPSVSAMATVREAAEPEKVQKKPLQRANELPVYTSTELSELLEARASVRVLVDEAQQILGKMFNPSDINTLIGMLDYLGMSEECILLLLAHCKRIGKVNLRAIEKYAYALVDKGITDAEAMEAEICAAEAMHSFEGQVRSLFGMKARALTSKEGKMLSSWISFGYDIDIVRMAYEITVDATGEASLPYANAILEKWNANGWKSSAQIEEGLKAEKSKREAKKAGASELGNSFDTDDFFEAALQRGFRERSEG